MGKQFSQKSFNVNDHVSIFCRAENTRYGFRHVADCFGAGPFVTAKVCYYNRTWERYEFQTVLKEVGHKVGGDLGREIKEFAEKYQDEESASFLSTVGLVAALGSIMTDSQTAANDWKVRMLKAGVGDALDMPDDWPTLSEDEKQRRLDLAIQSLQA